MGIWSFIFWFLFLSFIFGGVPTLVKANSSKKGGVSSKRAANAAKSSSAGISIIKKFILACFEVCFIIR